LAQQAPWLANRVREAALQLAPLAAAQAPAQRMGWAQRMQADLQQSHTAPALQYEQAIASLAVVWAGHSAYATDALFDAIDTGEPQALLLVPGLQDDPLARQLLAHAQAVRPQTTCLLEWPQALLQPGQATLPPARLHATLDPEDEAQCAAACVQRVVQQEQGLVALVDNDRALTRRISALLADQELAVRDETGWKLSTTIAASFLSSVCFEIAFSALSSGSAALTSVESWRVNIDSTGVESLVPVFAFPVDAASRVSVMLTGISFCSRNIWRTCFCPSACNAPRTVLPATSVAVQA
jgi:ATP-dependent helicase/nuclease subunit B